MPRRKKNGQSPARVPEVPQDDEIPGDNTGYRPPQVHDSAMGDVLPNESTSSSLKEKMVRSMQEMFSHLDPEVIFIVLSECDFKGKHQNTEDSPLSFRVTNQLAWHIVSIFLAVQAMLQLVLVHCYLLSTSYGSNKPLQLMSRKFHVN